LTYTAGQGSGGEGAAAGGEPATGPGGAATTGGPATGDAQGGQPAGARGPSPDSLVVTVSGDHEYGNTIVAWLESRAGDRGFELIDWPSVSDRPLERVARYHLAGTAEVVNSERLDYFGESTIQYTANLTLRVVDPATGSTLAGPASETVKYTSINAEQNLRAATRRLSDRLFREIR